MSAPVEVLPSTESEVASLVGQALHLLRQAWVVSSDECSRPMSFLLERCVNFLGSAHQELSRAAAHRSRPVRRTVEVSL